MVLKAVFDSNGTKTAYEMIPQSDGSKCLLTKKSVKAKSTLVSFELYDPAKKETIKSYNVPEHLQHAFEEGSYIVSYKLVNGSDEVEKAGEWVV